MKDILTFIGNHPWISFFLSVIALESFVRVSIVLPNRLMRHWNIRKHGYPPPHCDADGDFRKDEIDE